MTTPDPRDRALDDLLRRTLKAEAGTPGSCPDAGTLAAWMDGTLDVQEVSALEAHAAGCARCQATMAAFVQAVEGDGAIIPADGFHGAGAPSRAIQADPIRPDTVGQRPSPPRHGMVRWLAPLAAAAAVLIYVLTPGEGPLSPAQAPESTQARAEDTVPEAPATTFPGLGGEPAPPIATAIPDPATGRAASAAGPTTMDAPSPLAATRTTEKTGQSATTRSPETVEAAAPLLETTAPVEPAAAARATPAPASPPPSPSAPAAAGAPAPADLQASRERLAQNALTGAGIRSADEAVRWRFAGPRAVERSVDGGATWTRLDTGAPDQLTAGDAPSALVCWLVGRNGIVLRTVDGRAWQAVTRPTNDDLVAVDARDAITATVRTVDGGRFRTSDGGATWAAVR